MSEKIAIVEGLKKAIYHLFSILFCAVIELGLDFIIGNEAIPHVFIRSLIVFVLTFVISRKDTRNEPPDPHGTTIEKDDEKDSKNTESRLRIISPRSRR